jgi:hypothetical protein
MAKSKKSKLDSVEAAQDLSPASGHEFKVGDKKFKYVIGKFSLPCGERTALEAATDDTVYEELGNATINEYMVKLGSGCVEEI